MRILTLVRHAKTQADSATGRDFDRELTDRGRRDSARIGKLLRGFDLVLSSPAARAVQTASLAGLNPTLDERIYNASAAELISIVRETDRAVESLLMIGHNPGFEELASALGNDPQQDVRLPTAGLAVLDFDVVAWGEIQPGSGRLRDITTPKQLTQS